MPRANCVQQHHHDVLTAINRRRPPLFKFVLPKFHNLFSANKWRCVLINLPLAKHFSSLSHQISMTSNLNSPGEKWNTHTPHYASAAVAGFAKKNRRAFTKTVPCLCMSQLLQVRQVLKQIRRWKTAPQKFALSQASSLPKSSSPHPRTECSSMGDLRHKRVVCFHANAYVWKPEDIVQLSRMAIFSVRHHTSLVWRGEMTKRSIWNQNNVFKLPFCCFFF